MASVAAAKTFKSAFYHKGTDSVALLKGERTLANHEHAKSFGGGTGFKNELPLGGRSTHDGTFGLRGASQSNSFHRVGNSPSVGSTNTARLEPNSFVDGHASHTTSTSTDLVGKPGPGGNLTWADLTNSGSGRVTRRDRHEFERTYAADKNRDPDLNSVSSNDSSVRKGGLGSRRESVSGTPSTTREFGTNTPRVVRTDVSGDISKAVYPSKESRSFGSGGSVQTRSTGSSASPATKNAASHATVGTRERGTQSDVRDDKSSGKGKFALAAGAVAVHATGNALDRANARGMQSSAQQFHQKQVDDAKHSLGQAGLPSYIAYTGFGNGLGHSLGTTQVAAGRTGYSSKIPGNSQTQSFTGSASQAALGWGNIL